MRTLTRPLVLLLTLALSAPAVAAKPDPNAPIHDDGLERVGVLPFRVTGKGKKQNKKDAALYFQLLVEVFEKERGNTFSLANPKERTLRASSKKAVLRAVRKRAKAAKVSRVIAGTLSGRGNQQFLNLELFDLTGHTLSKYRVKARNRPASEWAREVMEAFVLAPPPPPEPEPEPEPAVAATADTPAAAPGEPAPPPAAVSGEGSSAALWWTVGAVSLGVLGAAAFTGGGLMGAEAWAESEELIKLQPGPERSALEESSIQKAVLADSLFVTGAVLVAGCVGAGFFAAFAGGGE